MLILALDISSTCLGYALGIDPRIEQFGHYDLSGGIAERCHKARLWALAALERWRPALVIIETPAVSRNPVSGIIPQIRVSGAVLAELGAHEALWEELSPAAASVALTGRGNHPKGQRKRAMTGAAAVLLGFPSADIRTVRGKVCAVAANGTPILTEDEADAIGLALAGMSVRVEIAA